MRTVRSRRIHKLTRLCYPSDASPHRKPEPNDGPRGLSGAMDLSIVERRTTCDRWGIARKTQRKTFLNSYRTRISLLRDVCRRVAIAAALFLAAELPIAAQNDWDWTWANPKPSAYSFNGVAINNSRTVLVGGAGMSAMREGDGEWSNQTTGVRGTLNDVVWTGDEFVAIGQDGVAVTSPDGVAWTAYATGTGVWLSALTWTGTQLVAVGAKETILTSSTGGKRWDIRQTNPEAFGGFAEVVWTGDLLVAVGGTGRIMTSTDGVVWTWVETGTSRSFSSVVSTGSKIVAFGAYENSHVVASSTDGSQWTVSEQEGPYLDSRSMAWTGERFVVAGVGRFATSTNLEDWVIHWYNAPGSFTNFAWTGTELLATARGGLLSSSDGIVWTDLRPSSLREVTWESVVWSGEQWVATGSGGILATSPDGLTWTKRTSSATATISSVTWTGSTLFAVCLDGTTLTSSDGISWQQRDPGFFQWSLNAVAWSGSQYLAVGPKGAIRSQDGIDWEICLEANYLMDVVWTGSNFAIQSYFGSVLLTTDGSDWSNLSGVRGGNAITWTGSHMVMVGDEIAVRGNDGAVWRIENDSSDFFYGVVAAGDEVVAVGARKIWSSSDLNNWRPDPVFSQWNSFWFKDAAWNGQQLIVVGSGGTILSGIPREREGERTFTAWLGDNEPTEAALLDYAFAEPSPQTNDLRHHARMAEGGIPRFQFTRNIDRKDVTFDVQVTDDLISWNSIATLQSGKWLGLSPHFILGESGSDTSGFRTVTLEEVFETDLEDPEKARFFRIVMEHIQ